LIIDAHSLLESRVAAVSAQNQPLAMREWARIIFDRPNNNQLFVILKDYIDESYWPPERPKLFTLACTMSDIKGWQEINTAWKLCLNAKNRELAKQGRKTLSRYHATDCANLKNEFTLFPRSAPQVGHWTASIWAGLSFSFIMAE
jgi:hypothetical protein